MSFSLILTTALLAAVDPLVPHEKRTLKGVLAAFTATFGCPLSVTIDVFRTLVVLGLLDDNGGERFTATDLGAPVIERLRTNVAKHDPERN